MFTNHATSGLLIFTLLAGLSEPKRCQAWIHQPTRTSRSSSYLLAQSHPQHFQRRQALIQGFHILIGTSLLIPQSAVGYFDYTDEEIELEEQAKEVITTPPPPPPQSKKKTPSKRRRFPFERDNAVPPVITDSTSTVEPVITEPVVVTPSVEEPTVSANADPAQETVQTSSGVQCLTDCMNSCQQEASANDKIACLDKCPTRCLSESWPPQQPEESAIVER